MGEMSLVGSHYLCLNCGKIAHEDHWTYWQRRDDWEDKSEEFRPSEDGESDAFMKCPCCGEMHGDCHYGAGVEEGTKAEVEAKRDKLAPDRAAEWLDAVAEVMASDEVASTQPISDNKSGEGNG